MCSLFPLAAMRCLIKRIRFDSPFAAHAQVAHSFYRSFFSIFFVIFFFFAFQNIFLPLFVTLCRRVCPPVCVSSVCVRQIGRYFRSNVNSTTSSSSMLILCSKPICSFIYWIECARFDTLVHSWFFGRRRCCNTEHVHTRTYRRTTRK